MSATQMLSRTLKKKKRNKVLKRCIIDSFIIYIDRVI